MLVNNIAAAASVLWIFAFLFLLMPDPWWPAAWAILGFTLVFVVFRLQPLMLTHSAVLGSALGFSLKAIATELQVPAWWFVPAAFLLSFYFPYILCTEGTEELNRQ